MSKGKNPWESHLSDPQAGGENEQGGSKKTEGERRGDKGKKGSQRRRGSLESQMPQTGRHSRFQQERRDLVWQLRDQGELAGR